MDTSRLFCSVTILLLVVRCWQHVACWLVGWVWQYLHASNYPHSSLLSASSGQASPWIVYSTEWTPCDKTPRAGLSWLLCWVFQPTNKTTKTNWFLFLQALGNLILKQPILRRKGRQSNFHLPTNKIEIWIKRIRHFHKTEQQNFHLASLLNSLNSSIPLQRWILFKQIHFTNQDQIPI